MSWLELILRKFDQLTFRLAQLTQQVELIEPNYTYFFKLHKS